MNFTKYGFDGLSQSFAQFQMIYIFLGYFFQNISQMMVPYRARSLVVSDLRSETKGSRFKSGCQLCTEVSSLQ